MSCSSQVVGALITIGDELLLGDIPNGNSHHIALELRSKGFRVGRMVTVGDGEEQISRCLQQYTSGYDFVIVTGGLGSTSDDRTMDAVRNVFERSLVRDADYEEWLKDYFEKHARPWVEDASWMAWVPEGAAKLIGSTPMAGFTLVHHDTPWFFLPGVPHEMRELLARHVIPALERQFPERPTYLKRILRVQGLAEPEIGRRLEDLARAGSGVEIGFLPQTGENWVTLFTAAESEEAGARRVEQVAEQIISRLGPDRVSGWDTESIEETVGRMLRGKGWRLALAESCTGGLISQRITSISGSSDYFDRGFITYSNRAKEELLGVSPDLLNAHGAVSEPVALAMAQGARERAGVEAAVAVTGIAGPTGGTPEKPVGTVYIACAVPGGVKVEKHSFGGAREHIQTMSAQAALVLLWRMLSQ